MAAASTILIVDDYPDAVEVWALYLRAVGFNVLTAADGHAAVLEATGSHPDLIVLDLELPGLSGLEVASALRANEGTRAIPLIAVTGYSHAAQLEQARHWFDAIVVKPCDPQSLVNEIRRMLAPDAPRADAHGRPPVG